MSMDGTSVHNSFNFGYSTVSCRLKASSQNIFEFFKRSKGHVLQRLKMMGTKTIYDRIFLKCLCIPFIKHFMINVRKNIKINVIMSE